MNEKEEEITEPVEPPEVEEIQCDHPFDVLIQDESGYWNCMCGAVGKVGADFNRKLKFIIPNQKQTRQQRRAWERSVIKEYMKSAKRKFRKQRITT